MPVQKCTLNGSPGWKWGATGTCHTYKAGDDAASATAKKKAIREAIAAHGGKAPPAAEMSEGDRALLAEILASESGIGGLLRLADTELKAGDVTPVMLFPIGKWKSAKYHTRYPKGLPLTRETADLMVANFEANTLGIDVQFSTSGAHGLPAGAAFWVQSLKVAPYSWQGHEGEALWADAKWTQLGADAANGDEYRYLSIEAGDFETPTGDIVPWVLQGGVLTNYPIIKIMPPVRDAAEAIAAAEGPRTAEFEIALADLTMADDSYNALREELEAAVGAAFGERCWVNDFGDDWLIYEASSMEDPVHIYRVTYARGTTGITFGQPVEVKRETSYVPLNAPLSVSSPSGGAPAEPVGASASDEGVGGRLNLSKEQSMSELTELLKLSEGVDDAVILAEVKKVASDRDTAIAKLAENEHKTAIGGVTLKLDEAIKEGRIAPAERDGYLGLAELDAERATTMIDGRKSKVIDLEEHGSGTAGPEDTGKNASVELAELTRARMKADGVDFAKAKGLTLSENPNGIRERYDAFLNGHEEG